MLDPLLFNIFLNDSFKKIGASHINHADDSTPYDYKENIETVIRNLIQLLFYFI